MSRETPPPVPSRLRKGQIIRKDPAAADGSPADQIHLLAPVLDFIPEVIFIKDRDGRYLYVNGRFEDLTSLRSRQIVGRTDSELFPPRDAAEYRDSDRRVLTSGAPVDLKSSFRASNGQRALNITKFPLRDAAGEIYALCGAAIDVTDLQLAEAQFRDLLEAAPDAMILFDADQKIVVVNGQAAKIFRLRREELLGRQMETLVPDRFRGRHNRRPLFERPSATIPFFMHCLRGDGSEFPVDITVSPIESGRGPLTLSAFRDQTEHKRLSEEVRQVSSRLLQTQEAERRRFARDLHDDVNQQLALLTMAITTFEGEIESAGTRGALRERLAEWRTMTNRISDDVRRTAYQLHPSVLEHLGLVPALKSLCGDFAARASLDTAFRHRNVPDIIPPDVALCLYRIAQEALSNTVRHSGVKTASLFLAGGGGNLRMTILDKGAGFDTKARDRAGLGLVSMKERARLAGGSVTIQSERRKGTSVEATIPISGASAKEWKTEDL